jgi:hypothetical protein
MRILLAIHLGYAWLLDEGYLRFLRTSFRKDPNTHVLFFPSYPHPSNSALALVKEKFPKFTENFHYIMPEAKYAGRFPDVSKFYPYKRQFKQVIQSLKAKCGKGEKVRVLSFGGADAFCYKGVNMPAHEAIMRLFGKEHKVKASSFLPFIYGRMKPWPRNLKLKKPKITRRK